MINLLGQHGILLAPVGNCDISDPWRWATIDNTISYQMNKSHNKLGFNDLFSPTFESSKMK